MVTAPARGDRQQSAVSSNLLTGRRPVRDHFGLPAHGVDRRAAQGDRARDRRPRRRRRSRWPRAASPSACSCCAFAGRLPHGGAQRALAARARRCRAWAASRSGPASPPALSGVPPALPGGARRLAAGVRRADRSSRCSTTCAASPAALRLAVHCAAGCGRRVAAAHAGQRAARRVRRRRHRAGRSSPWRSSLAWSANLYNFMDGSDGLAGAMTIMRVRRLRVPPRARRGAAHRRVLALAAAAAAVPRRQPAARARCSWATSARCRSGFLAAAFGVAGVLARRTGPRGFRCSCSCRSSPTRRVTLARRALRAASACGEAHQRPLLPAPPPAGRRASRARSPSTPARCSATVGHRARLPCARTRGRRRLRCSRGCVGYASAVRGN